jgi:hypothetical protein
VNDLREVIREVHKGHPDLIVTDAHARGRVGVLTAMGRALEVESRSRSAR